MLASRSYVQVVKTLKASNEQNRFVQVQVLLYLQSNQSGEDGKSFHLWEVSQDTSSNKQVNTVNCLSGLWSWSYLSWEVSQDKFQQAIEHC